MFDGTDGKKTHRTTGVFWISPEPTKQVQSITTRVGAIFSDQSSSSFLHFLDAIQTWNQTTRLRGGSSRGPEALRTDRREGVKTGSPHRSPRSTGDVGRGGLASFGGPRAICAGESWVSEADSNGL